MSTKASRPLHAQNWSPPEGATAKATVGDNLTLCYGPLRLNIVVTEVVIDIKGDTLVRDENNDHVWARMWHAFGTEVAAR